MATRARLSQDRSRLRRDELLDAAIALFAEGGARGITHRAVAAKAGLPSATTTYYFKSIDELIDAALTRHIENWLLDLQSVTEIPLEADITFDDLAGLIAGTFAVRPIETIALNVSIYFAAARTPELRPKATEALEALETLAVKVLQHVGIVGAEDLARAVVTVLAGSALGRLSERRSIEETATTLYNSLRALATASVLGEEEITARLSELDGGSSSHDA
jgi:DNA-binding transcriptional regulator YbjK